MVDFSDIARPHLDNLVEPPEADDPSAANPTSSPLDFSDADDDSLLLDRLDTADFETVGVDASPENSAAAREVFPQLGTDVLAFYKSFRFVEQLPFTGKWGIFLIDAGIEAVSAEFRHYSPELEREPAERLAVQMLLEHERYHFWVDAWALSQEVVPIHPRIKRYEYYLKQTESVALTGGDYEESLANAFAFRKLASWEVTPGISGRPLLRAFMELCPQPYNQFDLSLSERERKEGVLAGAVLNGVAPSSQIFCGTEKIEAVLGASMRPTEEFYPLSDPEACPVYLVRDSAYASRVQPWRAPDRQEFRRFVENYLNGDQETKTDHAFYRIDNGAKVKYPNPHDKTIRFYERDNVLRKAGMRLPDYVEERQKTKVWKKDCPRKNVKPPLD